MIISNVVTKISLIFILFSLSSCTGKLWNGYYDIDSYGRFYDDGFTVLVLNENEIAILVSHDSDYFGKHSPKDKSYKKYRNLAYIYKFKLSDYEKIKEEVKNVLVEEEVDISFEKRDVIGKSGKFVIELIDGSEIAPEFVDLTMVDRPQNGIEFSDPKINHVRKIHLVGKNFDDDWSFLYRFPLSPIAITFDTTILVAGSAVAAAVVVTALPAWALFCIITNDPCH